MGWQSKLQIGNCHEQWRYYVPELVSLLFRAENYFCEFDYLDEVDPEIIGMFKSTVLSCRSCLDQVGFDWNFLTQVYARYRHVGTFAEGALSAVVELSDMSDSVKQQMMDQFENRSPEERSPTKSPNSQTPITGLFRSQCFRITLPNLLPATML
jgi:hypothetical protein